MCFCDSHIHSTCSPDGRSSMLDMVIASYKKGVKRICFTDHIDMDNFRTGEPEPEFSAPWQKIKDTYVDTVREAPKEVVVCLGIELGEINHNPIGAAELAASEELDFVLGSLHNLRGKMDFHELNYPDEKFCEELMEDYVDELIDMAARPCFDVMAHIGYPIRYIRKSGHKTELTMKKHGDKIEMLLKKLIDNGKGLEINCSGFRNAILRDSIPSFYILKRYKELGGEIITVGSDAHRVADAGGGIPEGFDILRRLGYKYVTAFEKRKPLFIKI